MLSDDLSATMDSHVAIQPDEHLPMQIRRGETTETTTRSTNTPPGKRQLQQDPRHGSGWTSPEASVCTTNSAALSGLSMDGIPPSSCSSAQPGTGDNQPNVSIHDGPALPGSTRTLAPPHITSDQLAFSALRYLPVPLLVLSSLKTVSIANDAMARLLDLIHKTAEEQTTSVSDRLCGQSLSQLGINMVKSSHSAFTDLEQYLDSLISSLGHIEDTGQDRSDVHRRPPHDDGHGKPTVDHSDTTAPDPVAQFSNIPAIVYVVITGRDLDRLSSSEPELRRASSPKRLAKMTVATVAPDNRETYFILTFTDIDPDLSSTLQPIPNKPATQASNEVPNGTGPLPDAASVEQLTSLMKEEDEKRFKILCDAMPQIVWMTTPEGDLEFYNRRWYEYTGLTEDVSMGHGWLRAVHPEDVPESDRLFQHSLETGKPFVAEYRCRRKEGEWKWFIARALPFRSKKTGKIERWLGTCTDANESIESRREVERTWQQLLTVISHAQVTVFQVDTQRRVTMLEGAMVEEALGGHNFGPRWYVGQDMYKVFGELSRAADERQQRFLGPIETILGGHPSEILQEDEIRGRFYRTRFLPIGVKDQDGRIRGPNLKGVIGVIRDVTELKSKEADIEIQTREKQQLMASEAAAKEASKLKSQFLANMSHEIRTPITGVIGMAELLLDLDLGEEQREFTENIYRSANALLTVINDILDFSKVESGRLDIEEVQFSLSVIVRDVDKMLSFAAKRKNLDFSSDISDHIVNDLVVMGDPGRVRQIVTNLLTNSIKFTNQGHVRFSVLKEKETEDTIEIKFVIEDTGIGIEEDVRKRLFVPFSQGDSSTARKFGGTGLGLTICKSLLDLMHGRITLESTIGSGTTATFWIPFRKPGKSDSNLVRIDPLSDRLQSDMSVSGNSSEADGLLANVAAELASTGLYDGLKPSRSHRKTGSNITPSPPPSTDALSLEERSNIHILVVEDNAINQQIAIKTIQKLGFNVSAAWNGKEALEYLMAAQEGKKRKPDVILMDVQMPVIDGYKCTHLLRYHLPYKTYVQDVPIVAMTASAIQGDREKCRKAGMDDYLAKPVRGRILEKMLVRWTARSRPDLSKMSSHGGSEISDIECSNAGEHCDSPDIPCVEHDNDDFMDLRRTPLDDFPQHLLDAVLPLSTGGQPRQQQQQQPRQQPPRSSGLSKPPLTRSDTEETQLVRKKPADRGDDLAQMAERTPSKTSNETDSDVAAQSRDVKLFDAAGAGPEQLPHPHAPSPSPSPSSAGGEMLTEANMERHMQEEEFKLWHSDE